MVRRETKEGRKRARTVTNHAVCHLVGGLMVVDRQADESVQNRLHLL